MHGGNALLTNKKRIQAAALGGGHKFLAVG